MISECVISEGVPPFPTQYASGSDPPKYLAKPRVRLHCQDNWKTAHSFMRRVGINMYGIEPAGKSPHTPHTPFTHLTHPHTIHTWSHQSHITYTITPIMPSQIWLMCYLPLYTICSMPFSNGMSQDKPHPITTPTQQNTSVTIYMHTCICSNSLVH